MCSLGKAAACSCESASEQEAHTTQLEQITSPHDGSNGRKLGSGGYLLQITSAHAQAKKLFLWLSRNEHSPLVARPIKFLTFAWASAMSSAIIPQASFQHLKHRNAKIVLMLLCAACCSCVMAVSWPSGQTDISHLAFPRPLPCHADPDSSAVQS